MKKSITFRLFIITAVFFLIFTAGTYLIQTIFISNFYVSRKISHLQNSLQQFNKDYTANIFDQGTVNSLMRKFQDDNGAKIIVENNTFTHLDRYVNDYTNTPGDLSKVTELSKVIAHWQSDTTDLNNLLSSGKIQTYIDPPSGSDIKNLVSVCPVILNGECVEVIVAVSSLQPVNESLSVIKEFSVYIFIFAGIITIILSFIYSRMISKPLVNLNRVASKMAQLDFSAECREDRQDEIGSLAKTLNFLSVNLHNALESLEDSNEKLREDIEKERHLEKMRKEFVAGVSHELKTPISIIEGFAEGLKDNIAEGESRDYYLDVIMDESKKMASLVSDMLDISQLESGNFKLNLSPFYIDKLIENINMKFTKIINEKNIVLNVSIPGSFLVEGDRSRIEQVITNFLTNAVKYTSEHHSINIRLLDKGSYILVEVENQGNNIEEDELTNIWDKFYKVDKARSRDAGGTGLGLSIAKNILLLHNSDFGTKNTDDGVVFYFTLNKSHETI